MTLSGHKVNLNRGEGLNTPPPDKRAIMNLNLQIVTCAHREITTGTCSSFELLRLRTKLLYVWQIFSHDALIARARSIACTRFYEKPAAPYMLFIDDDILFEPKDVDKIYRDMVNGYDLIAGCYGVKDGSQLASYGWHGDLEFDGRIVPIEYAATGFMGISHKLLEKIKTELDLPLLNHKDWARCYPFFETGRWTKRKGDPIYISEDWEFCEKSRQIGVQPHLDTGIWLGHQGQYIVDIQMVSKHCENLKAKRDATTGVGEKSTGKDGRCA